VCVARWGPIAQGHIVSGPLPSTCVPTIRWCLAPPCLFTQAGWSMCLLARDRGHAARRAEPFHRRDPVYMPRLARWKILVPRPNALSQASMEMWMGTCLHAGRSSSRSRGGVKQNYGISLGRASSPARIAWGWFTCGPARGIA
jgi:hypothetical protein